MMHQNEQQRGGGGGQDMMMMHPHNPHMHPHQQQQQQQQPPHQQQQQYGHQAQQQQQQQQQQLQQLQQQQQMQYAQHQQQQQQGHNGMPGMVPSQSWGGTIPAMAGQLQMGGVAMPLNGALPPLSMVNPGPQTQAAQVQMSPPQQPQQSPRGQPEFAVLSGQQSPSASNQSQLLAGTQNMLNGISAITSVVPAITPIGKVKRFQFGSPNGATPQSMLAQSQISPAYLPPLATTPRFAVPTPRGSQQYHAINLQQMNAPIQIRQVSSQQSTKEEETTTTTTAADLQGQVQMKNE